MFSFAREGALFVAAGATGAAASALLPHPTTAAGFVGGLTIVLPVMTAYALGISAAVRMPARTIRPLGAAFGLGGAVALLFAGHGLLGWAGALLLLLVAALAWRDGAEAFWRGLAGAGFAALAVALVFIPMIPLASAYIFSIAVVYLLLRHLWGVLSHDVPIALRHNAEPVGEPAE